MKDWPISHLVTFSVFRNDKFWLRSIKGPNLLIPLIHKLLCINDPWKVIQLFFFLWIWYDLLLRKAYNPRETFIYLFKILVLSLFTDGWKYHCYISCELHVFSSNFFFYLQMFIVYEVESFIKLAICNILLIVLNSFLNDADSHSIHYPLKKVFFFHFVQSLAYVYGSQS